jgi:preprotein translocase subunit SecG
MLYYLVATLYVLACLLLIVVVLLQQGKGGDIANAFGGGASQAAFGARSGATVLSRATTVLAVLFVVGAITLGVLGQRGPASVLGGRAQPNAPPPATQIPAGSRTPGPAAPAPAAPAPAAPAPAAPATPPATPPAAPAK